MSRNKCPVLLALLALLLAGCQEKPERDDLIREALLVPEQINHVTATVEVRSYSLDTQSAQLLTRYAVFPVSEAITWNASGAKLEKTLVNQGEVEAGEALMTFSVDQHRADLEELRLELDNRQTQRANGKQEREAEIAAAEQDLTGLTGHEKEIASLELDKKRTEYEKFLYQCDLDICDLRERIDALSQTAANNTLYAPMDGNVTEEAELVIGDPVPQGSILYSIENRDVWFVRTPGISIPYNATVYFTTAEELAKYDSADELVEKGKIWFTGTVVASAHILPAGTTQETWIRLGTDMTLKQAEKEKLVGVYPNLELSEVLTIPKDALRTEEDRYYVNILENGVICKRYVTVGAWSRNAEESLWILDGVCAGQTLVLS